MRFLIEPAYNSVTTRKNSSPVSNAARRLIENEKLTNGAKFNRNGRPTSGYQVDTSITGRDLVKAGRPRTLPVPMLLLTQQ